MQPRRVLVVVVVAVGASSCTPPGTVTPAELTLSYETRQSCGSLGGGSLYDTSCLAAIDLAVLDEQREVKFEDCRPIGDFPADQRPLAALPKLGDIASGTEPIFDFTRLTASGIVVFQLIGLHNKVVLEEGADPNPCRRNPRASRDDWLFFGESRPVDLALYAGRPDAGPPPPPLIDIALDCRDCTFTGGDCTAAECFGCGGIDPPAEPEPQCPAEFPPSFCVPAAPTCTKTCDTRDDCFDGARDCVDGQCDTGTDGAFCSPCSDDVGCGDGLVCVRDQRGGQPFCSLACPFEQCPSTTKCNRLGNELCLDADPDCF